MRTPKTVACVALALGSTLPAFAQYPGQVTKKGKDNPELRAIAVLEWTGAAGKPNASRLVPVAVLDGGQLQDGGLYLARPAPMAVAGGVEYELEQDGKPVGLFDIQHAAQEQGSWVGYGSWRSMPVDRPKPSARELARTGIDDDSQSDQPVLHRKHHADDKPAPDAGSGSGSGSDSGGQAQSSDPDRPTLHKKPSTDSTGDASSSSKGTASTSSSAPDPDQPTLHRKAPSDSTGDDSASSNAPPGDPDRPVLKKSKKKEPEETGHVDSLSDVTDPDRPLLKRGKFTAGNLELVPSLMGMPPQMQQAVAVSDAKAHPQHLWNYAWANPDDEAKMKLALEGIAGEALGLNPPPPAPKPATRAAPTKTAVQRKAKPKPPAPAPPPPALMDEQFRVFELAYGSGATMVLTAHTDGPVATQKFVALVAQPDLYGNVLVLLKSTTDGGHLDETPRMRLVDAVDAMADNRGELLFELRGATQRQFALYRVLRGQAEKLFASGAEDSGVGN